MLRWLKPNVYGGDDVGSRMMIGVFGTIVLGIIALMISAIWIFIPHPVIFSIGGLFVWLYLVGSLVIWSDERKK